MPYLSVFQKPMIVNKMKDNEELPLILLDMADLMREFSGRRDEWSTKEKYSYCGERNAKNAGRMPKKSI